MTIHTWRCRKTLFFLISNLEYLDLYNCARTSYKLLLELCTLQAGEYESSEDSKSSETRSAYSCWIFNIIIFSCNNPLIIFNLFKKSSNCIFRAGFRTNSLSWLNSSKFLISAFRSSKLSMISFFPSLMKS